jgi:hypothetical protein
MMGIGAAYCMIYRRLVLIADWISPREDIVVRRASLSN